MNSEDLSKHNPIPEKLSHKILDKLKDEKLVILYSIISLVSATIGLTFVRGVTFNQMLVILGGFILILSCVILLKKSPKQEDKSKSKGKIEWEFDW